MLCGTMHVLPPLTCRGAERIVNEAHAVAQRRRLNFHGYGMTILDGMPGDVSCGVAWAPTYVQWSCGVFTGPFTRVTWTDQRTIGGRLDT